MTLIDECDELTQGKGNKSLNVPHREDPGTYQQYISEDARGEDEEDDVMYTGRQYLLSRSVDSSSAPNHLADHQKHINFVPSDPGG